MHSTLEYRPRPEPDDRIKHPLTYIPGSDLQAYTEKFLAFEGHHDTITSWLVVS